MLITSKTHCQIMHFYVNVWHVMNDTMILFVLYKGIYLEMITSRKLIVHIALSVERRLQNSYL